MPTQCKPISFAFQGCQGRKVTAAFDGGSITSNAGALLLRAVDRSIGLIDRVAACFTDHRAPHLTEHSVRTLVAQRTMGIALGYEDLNDHDELRHDPLLALLSGKLEGRREGCAALAGKSTLNRLEHAPRGGKLGRYHKIEHDPEALQAVLLESFIDSWKGRPPSRLVLDIDSTDDEVHGRQEGRSYHGYYGHYCFLPLYITCGGNADPVGCIITRLRRQWPGLKILLRADSDAREEQDNGVDHVIGLARNSRREDRLGAGRRAGRSRQTGTGRPPVHRVLLCHPDKLVAEAPGDREGRTPARQSQPPLRRHFAARDLLGTHRLRASTARGATWP